MTNAQGDEWDMHGHDDYTYGHLMLRGLQSSSSPNSRGEANSGGGSGTVAILIVLIALFCFIWYVHTFRLDRMYSECTG
jgi:hypothetical protein